jgi:hypothetical protein
METVCVLLCLVPLTLTGVLEFFEVKRMFELAGERAADWIGPFLSSFAVICVGSSWNVVVF